LASVRGRFVGTVRFSTERITAMGGAIAHHATIPENARQLFYQTWPGWTYGRYRAFDLPAEDAYLADLIPWSATFTGYLKDAEAIYNGARGNLVGIRTRIGNTPQHGVLFGMPAPVNRSL
jgi:type IV secretion system protein TrbE